MATECKHHDWKRDPEGDYCGKCGQSWLTWTKGFDSNVRPFHRKPEPLVRPTSG